MPSSTHRPWIGAAPPGERERLRSGRPTVSIVTPSFNQARFLEQTLRSVLDQDYSPLEYIVIDGGSTDGSVDILRRYADRLAYWVSEPDAGQTDALNKGFARARGDVIGWVNSDDFYYPGAIAAAVAAFRADPDVGMVYGRGNRVDEDGGVIREFETQPFDLETLVYGIDYILQPTVFMRRQALHEVGPFDPHLHYAFDWELWMRLGKRARVAAVDRLLAAGREYAGTKTVTGGLPRAEEIRQIVRSHTGQELTVGSLTYWLQTIHDVLPRADIADARRLGAVIGQAIELCGELVSDGRLRTADSARPPMRREVPAYTDGWAGADLRVHRALPTAGNVLRLTGVHEECLASIGGPLTLWAFVNGHPLGAATQAAGPFTVCWRVPEALVEALHAGAEADGAASRCEVAIVSATSVVPSRFWVSEDARALAFRFVDLAFQSAPPQGPVMRRGDPNGAS